MLAVSAGSDSESRRSHSSPKLGNTTASSRPITSRCLGPGRRFPVVSGELLVVAVFGGRALTTALAVAAQHGGVTGNLHVGHVEAVGPAR